jgi:hypothetical protein
MKKIKLLIAAFVVVFSFGLLAQPALPAAASPSEDVTVIIENLIDKETEIFAKTSEDPEVVANQFTTYADTIRNTITKLAAIETSSGHKAKINDIVIVLNKLASSSDAMAQATLNQDDSAYWKAFNDFDATIDELNITSEAYVQYLKDNPLESGDGTYAMWFVILIISVACLVVAIIIVAAGRNQRGIVPGSEDGKKKPVNLSDVRRNILIAAVIFVVGAAIPAVQYYLAVQNAAAGEEFTYYIFWYPLAFGASWFVLSIFQYLFNYSKLKKSGGLRSADDATAAALEKINKSKPE